MVTFWPFATSSTHTGPVGAKVTRCPPATNEVGAVRPWRDQVAFHACPSRSTVALPVPVSWTTGVGIPLTPRLPDGRVVTYCTTTVVVPYWRPVGPISGRPS